MSEIEAERMTETLTSFNGDSWKLRLPETDRYQRISEPCMCVCMYAGKNFCIKYNILLRTVTTSCMHAWEW